jgi:D-tagatose-bisphosphate aldolase class II non-catalytic subunit
MSSRHLLRAIVADNRGGRPRGIASWCTAHGETLRAILRAHRGSGDPILIEATCNQVNQHGGYRGMTPAGFRAFVEGLAREAGVDVGRIILGGDHLGPNPWKAEPAAGAMAEARDMVRAYVEAGFTKIHLDASMACAGDHELSETAMAERAAELCAVAERAGGGGLSYVIGTEVPVPGGETRVVDELAVTRPEAPCRTFDLHRDAFAKRGLDDAMGRIIGVVVQPGVDFGNSQVFIYESARAVRLSAAVHGIPGAVFEAHSTDYQPETALSDLVADHFAILKVGPELTFAFREAVVAMAAIEQRLSLSTRSDILDVIAAEMDEDPRYWRGYIAADEQQDTMRLFGLSDRIRYYWPKARIGAALETLMANIDAGPVPLGVLSQYAGQMRFDDETLPLSQRIVQARVGAVVAKYRRACGSTG